MDYKYDVTFSFAGENREYVSQVANILREAGVSVFYDEFEEVDLWGKDLGLHFDYVYRKQAKYFIPFVSADYKRKMWTNYEFRTALSRAIENNEEYILPAKFDDTILEGLRPSIGFLDLRRLTPQQFAERVKAKVGLPVSVPIAQAEQEKPFASVYLSVNMAFSGSSFGIESEGVTLGVTITNLDKQYRYFNAPYFHSSAPIVSGQDTFYLTKLDNPVKFPVKLEYGEQFNVSYPLSVNSHETFKAVSKDAKLTAIVTTTIGEKVVSNETEFSSIHDCIIYYESEQ